LAGARESSLPTEYIKKIESIESVEDPDASRAHNFDNPAFDVARDEGGDGK
jgi:hypothetical protein